METELSLLEIEASLQKEALLESRISELGSLVVAYSGGVDSSLLAYYARMVLGSRAKIVIGVSPSLAGSSLLAAQEQAKLFDWDLVCVHTDETDLESYRKNDGMRCYFCKATLFEKLQEMAESWRIDFLASGANVNDLVEVRPGQKAADRFRVLSPLVESGLTKPEIRFLAKQKGLPSWNRPQDACLASRIPVNTVVTIDKLSRVEKAEAFIRSLKFGQVRVRHFENHASVEVGVEDLNRFDTNPGLVESIKSKLKEFGFSKVSIDPRGYRMGSVSSVPEVVSNETLT